MTTELTRRHVLKLALQAVGVSLLVACTPKTVKETVKETVLVEKQVTTEKAVTATPAPKKQVQLEWAMYCVASFEPVFLAIADAFNAQGTGITVHYECIPRDYNTVVATRMAGGEQLDFMNTDWNTHGDYISQGALRKLEDYLALSDVGFDDFYPEPLESAKYKGEYWGIPWSCHGSVVYYNKTLFDQEGVDYPPADGNWTLEDFAEIARKFVKKDEAGNVIQFGFDLPPIITWTLGDLLRMWGGWWANDDRTKVTFTSEEAKAALAWYATQTGERVATSSRDSTALGGYPFASGKVAMHYCQSARIGVFQGVEFDWDITEAPYSTVLPNTKSSAFCPNYWVIPATSKFPDEAWELMKFNIWGSGMNFWAALPYPVPRKSLMQNVFAKGTGKPQNRAALLNMYKWTSPGNLYGPGFNDFRNKIEAELDPVWNGLRDLDEAIAAAAEAAQKVLDENPM